MWSNEIPHNSLLRFQVPHNSKAPLRPYWNPALIQLDFYRSNSLPGRQVLNHRPAARFHPQSLFSLLCKLIYSKSVIPVSINLGIRLVLSILTSKIIPIRIHVSVSIDKMRGRDIYTSVRHFPFPFILVARMTTTAPIVVSTWQAKSPQLSKKEISPHLKWRLVLVV